MAEQSATVCLALVGKGLGRDRELLLLSLVVGRRVSAEEAVDLAVVQALDRRRASDASGVEAHDVVYRTDLLGEDGCADIVNAGPTRAAWIDHERADPPRGARGRDPEQS